MPVTNLRVDGDAVGWDNPLPTRRGYERTIASVNGATGDYASAAVACVSGCAFVASRGQGVCGVGTATSGIYVVPDGIKRVIPGESARCVIDIADPSATPITLELNGKVYNLLSWAALEEHPQLTARWSIRRQNGRAILTATTAGLRDGEYDCVGGAAVRLTQKGKDPAEEFVALQLPRVVTIEFAACGFGVAHIGGLHSRKGYIKRLYTIEADRDPLFDSLEIQLRGKCNGEVWSALAV